uniref:Uncharacterized protein n=1 Tax=Anopheles merus TaxID=30066 RepID=A0A182VG68_ANOME
MCLKSGKLLHHLTILYSRWSAMLQRFAIKSGLLSDEMPALDRIGLLAIVALLTFVAGWFSRASSCALYCHSGSTSMISYKDTPRQEPLAPSCPMPVPFIPPMPLLIAPEPPIIIPPPPPPSGGSIFICWPPPTVEPAPPPTYGERTVPPYWNGPGPGESPACMPAPPAPPIGPGSVYEHWHFSNRQAGHFLRVAILLCDASLLFRLSDGVYGAWRDVSGDWLGELCVYTEWMAESGLGLAGSSDVLERTSSGEWMAPGGRPPPPPGSPPGGSSYLRFITSGRPPPPPFLRAAGMPVAALALYASPGLISGRPASGLISSRFAGRGELLELLLLPPAFRSGAVPAPCC